MNPDASISINGTIDDVASFFGVAVRTVQEWKKDRKISFWQDGRNVVFGEEAVIEYRAAGYVSSRRLEPGEAKEIARREWREHKKLRSEFSAVRSLEERMEVLDREIREIRERDLRRAA